MKKKLTRILAALLIAMMLIPTLATFAVSAEEGTGETEEKVDVSDIVNLYELNKVNAAPAHGSGTKKDDAPVDEEGVLASKPFESTRTGDKYIYVGPCPDPKGFDNTDEFLYWYKKDGNYTSAKKTKELEGDVVDGGNVVGRFEDGSVILRIKNTSSNYKFAALRISDTTYADFILVTSERPFTVDEYYAYADAQGWELDGTALRPLDPVVAEDAPEGHEGFWNYFSPDEDFVAPSTQKDANNKYQVSDYISVTEGDVITIGAVSTKENQSILYAYSDETVPGKNAGGPVTLEYKSVKQFKKGDVGIDFVENIGYDYAIYSYTVGEGVSFVKVSMPESTYGNGDVLVTKNQEFKGAQFRQALEIPALSTDAKNHDFSGKNALFVGDSIFAGEYDTPVSFSTPSMAFARRLALATGLNPTVFAATGATIGQTGKSNVKYAYDLLKTALMSKKNYDMVIFQGGINDARQNIEVGEILPVDTEREVLADLDRTKTFAGALQLMFYDALNKWTDAEFYYVASYKTVPAAVNDKDISLYYAQAKALCEIYGIHYIDLYGDTELYKTFNYENAELFADDQFTPLSATYDVLFPSVLSLFNKSLNEDLVNPFAATNDILPPVDTEPDGLSLGAIIGIAAAGVVVLAGGGFALYWFVIRKKTVNKAAVAVSTEASVSEPEVEKKTKGE